MKKIYKAILSFILVLSWLNSHSQFVKLFSDSLITLNPSIIIGNVLERDGYFYMGNHSSDEVGNVYTLIKVDTAGNTIWTTHPMNYIDAGVFNQNRVFQKIVFGMEGEYIYSLLDGVRVGRIKISNGSIDWIVSVTDILGGSRADFVDYDSSSVLYANASSSINKVRICRIDKYSGENMGYVDLPCSQPNGFGIYILNNNIYLASQDTCYKYASFDDPTLIWKTKISNSLPFYDSGIMDQFGDDLLIFGNRNSTFMNGRIACVDRQTGAFKWLTETGSTFSVDHADHKIKNGFLYTSWEHAFVGSIVERCLINKINLSTGAMVWQFNHEFRTQTVTTLPTEAMVSFDIDDNEMIYMTGYGLPDNYNVKSWGFMKVRGSDGAVLNRNYIPDLAPLSPDFSRAFFLKLIDNKPYSFGFRASTLAKALLDTAQLSVIQDQPMVTKIQFPSALIGMTSFSDTKKILLKKVGKGLKIEMVDASYNRIWEKLINDTINYYMGYDILHVNDSTKKIYIVARKYNYTSANNFFFYYETNSVEGFTVYEFDSIGNNTSNYYYSDNPFYQTPLSFTFDSLKRTSFNNIRSASILNGSISSPPFTFSSHHWVPRSYPPYKPVFYFGYENDTAYSFGGSGPGTYGPARFVKEWYPNFGAQTRIYPIYYSLYLVNSVESENKDNYYLVGKDSTFKDMLLKYRTSDSSVVWYKKFDSSIITYKCFHKNAAIYAVSSQNKDILLRKINSDDGSLLWTFVVPVPTNSYLKLMDFGMSKQRNKITIAGNLVDTIANKDMSKVFAITFDTLGNIVSQVIDNGYKVWTNKAVSVLIANDGQTLIGGQISDSAYGFAGFIYAIDSSGLIGVPPLQPGIISGSDTVCQYSSQVYSVNPVAGATSYTWSLPSGWNGSSSVNTINVTVGGTGGTISVTANNGYGSSAPQTKVIVVNPLPSLPGSISGSTTPCAGTIQTYSISPVTGATNYIWTLPSGWTGISSTNSIQATAGPNGGTITITANNSCGSGPTQSLAVAVNEVPVQPGAISGGNTICKDSTQTYSVNPVAGASSYSWTIPTGWSGSSTTNTIQVTANNNSGTISVIANNNCGGSLPQSIAVTVNQVPAQPGTISGSNTICKDSTQTYSVAVVPNATSYTWTLPTGWAGTSTTNSIQVTAGPSGGTITVKANNSCGSSPVQSLAVTVEQVPVQPGNISGNTTVNTGQTLSYGITSVSGAISYNWSLSGGGNIVSGQNTNSITINWTSQGNYILSVNAANNCGASSNQTLNIAVSFPTGITNPDNQFQIKIVPNPSPGEFYLTAKGVINKVIKVEVLDILGQVIYSSEQMALTNNYSQLLDLRSFANGIYNVKIYLSKKIYLRRIAKIN